jgi:hypothetical protein
MKVNLFNEFFYLIILTVLRSKQNDLFSCKHKPILMSALLFFGINSCMESNKTNLKLLYLG